VFQRGAYGDGFKESNSEFVNQEEKKRKIMKLHCLLLHSDENLDLIVIRNNELIINQ
jgi:hypothetical protein